jgi:hypothetical protein
MRPRESAVVWVFGHALFPRGCSASAPRQIESSYRFGTSLLERKVAVRSELSDCEVLVEVHVWRALSVESCIALR